MFNVRPVSAAAACAASSSESGSSSPISSPPVVTITACSPLADVMVCCVITRGVVEMTPAWRLRWWDSELIKRKKKLYYYHYCSDSKLIIVKILYLESVNRWSHMLHLNGFSPVWTLLRCSASLWANKNPLPHHSHAWGRSFECLDFWCNVNLSRVINALPHSPQWNAAIPVCKAMWYLRPRGVLKPRGHWNQFLIQHYYYYAKLWSTIWQKICENWLKAKIQISYFVI